MKEIDGTFGEGGGQILRTSLALSSILNQPVRISGIRTGRKKPGLMPQHLTCVQALQRITGAETRGASIGSRELEFRPRSISSGTFSFNVASMKSSAGSVALVLQALLPVLLHGPRQSKASVQGGTHVEWSPPAHYFNNVLFPMLKIMGVKASLSIDRWGWYPRGGGKVTLEVGSAGVFHPLRVTDRGGLIALRGLSVSSMLPMGVAKRMRREADGLLRDEGYDAHIRMFDTPGDCPGAGFILWAEFENSWAGFSALGKRGRPAEEVARDAVSQFLRFAESGAAIDEHLADQLIIYMALADGLSLYSTERITRHVLTAIHVVEQFLPVKFLVVRGAGEGGTVERIQ